MVGGLAAATAFAASLTPPTLTAWQRALEGHLTIEWPDTVRVAQKRVGDRLVLRFSEPLAIDAATALANLSNVVDPSRSTVDGADLSLALRPGVSSKVGLREKRIVTIDFVRDADTAPVSRIEASAIEGGVRLTMDWSGPTEVESTSEPDRLRLKLSPAPAILPGELTDLEGRLAPWFRSLKAEQAGADALLSFALEPQVVPTVRSFGPTTTVVDLIRDASARNVAATKPEGHVFIPKPRPVSSATVRIGPAEAGPPIPEKRPQFSNSDTAIAAGGPSAADRADAHGNRPEVLTIAWDEPVGAAVFVRAGHLWAVFDQPDAGLLSTIPASPRGLGPASIVPADGGTALRFALDDRLTFGVTQTADGHWRIAAEASAASLKSPEIKRIDGSTALRISPAPSRRIVSIVDPDVGDRIDVLPLRKPGIGQAADRRFVDLHLMPTTQGLAWRPLADHLSAKVENEALIISSPRGLLLSDLERDPRNASPPQVIDAVARKEPEGEKPAVSLAERPASHPPVTPEKPATDEIDDMLQPSSYLNLAGPGIEPSLIGEYRRLRRQAIIDAPPLKRDRAKLNLARLLVAERLATEARTVLDTISDDADQDVLLQKRALSGAAAFLIGHLAEATSLLLDPDLGEDDEIDIWRAALQSAEDRWQAAAGTWQTASDTLDSYPPRLKFDLGLMALEAAIETDDAEMMSDSIGRLTSLQVGSYDQARLDAMKALKAKRSGDTKQARTLFSKLKDSPNPVIRTFATFELAALDLDEAADGRQSLADLDRLMPLWRGHPNERSMLNELAIRHRDANALRKALTVWRRMIRLFPDAADDEELNVARQETFVQALVGTTERDSERHDAYAIYLDFKDLLPGEPEARIVHRRLAEHLVELDLLDPAIDVLRALATSSQDDIERAELTSTIATLMLRLQRPTPAIAVLESIGEGIGLPAALDQKRRLIAARALADLERTDEALRRLRDLRTAEAKRLQAEILWKAQRWPRLAAVIESYFDDADPSSPLESKDRELVLWLAMARQREGNSDQLEAVRDRFRRLMEDGPLAEAFDIATQSAIRADDIESLLTATGKQLAELQRFRQASAAAP